MDRLEDIGEGELAESCDAFSVIVLTGGKSRRIGRDKATLMLAGETLLDHALRAARTLSRDVIVVKRRDQSLSIGGVDVRLVCDALPYEGVMAGILAGLTEARHQWTLVLACDMPFVSLPLVRNMLEQRHEHDAVVPRLSVGLEPLHALYRTTCLDALRHALATGQRRVSSFYCGLDLLYVQESEIDRIDPEHWTFFNINTAQDLAVAQARLTPVP
jgi:molybdenum cofactor guanylyltransferase